MRRIIDFTYDKATEWYKGSLKRLLEMGVKCIKIDFGENIHGCKIQEHESWNVRQPPVRCFTRRRPTRLPAGDGDGIVWARAAWAGCQRYPLHWGGDSCSSWDGMAGPSKAVCTLDSRALLSGVMTPGFHTLPNFMNGICAGRCLCALDTVRCLQQSYPLPRHQQARTLAFRRLPISEEMVEPALMPLSSYPAGNASSPPRLVTPS